MYSSQSAVRDLLEPSPHAFLHAAMPVRAKAEQGAIKLILRHWVMHQVSHMNDATAQRILNTDTGCGSAVRAEFVPFGIAHLEVLASITCPRYVRRHFDTVRLEVLAHGT